MRSPLLPPPGLPADRPTVTALFAAIGADPLLPELGTWTVLDTPDGRLRASAHVLIQRGKVLALHGRGSLDQTAAMVSQPWSGSELSRFVADWPAGPVREAVAPLAKARAVLPLLTCRIERFVGHRRDGNGKTVARVEVWLVTPQGGERRIWAVVDGLRGYAREFRGTVGLVLGRGWRESGEDPLALLADEAAGPMTNNDLPDFPDDDAQAGPALRDCLGRTLERLAVLEEGVVEDIDTEFLHQHRVTLRRVRSLTAQFATVFSPEDGQRIRDLLAGWSRCSNTVRDLDVWLQMREDHTALVPARLRPGLEPLFEELRRDRAAAHKALAERLASTAHRKERAELATLVKKADSGPDGELPLVELARRRTWRTYRRAAREGALIDVLTPAEAVHQVRIRCKKLRYLLDSCGAATAPDDHDQLRAQLRGIQGVLGEFNDASVQSEALLARVEAHQQQPKTLLAVGALLGALDRHRHELNDRLLLGLADLAAPATRLHYRSLFRDGGEG